MPRQPIELPPRLGPCVELVPLGQGSMGSVYRARHTRLGRDVAVKVLDPRLGATDPVALQRFLREVQLLAQVDDPHVVRFIEAGQDGRLTWAVMELIAGQSLKRIQLHEPERRLSAPAAAWYLTQIARGLVAIHRAGIVHRDLKPENVIVDSSGRARIADFGLARGRDSQVLTMVDEVVGTPEYMAPEAILRRDVDGRADLYALGVTAYELLAGETPYHDGGVLEVVKRHLEEEPRPLRELRPELARELCELVHRLLAKDPARRPPSAAAAAEAFAPFAAHEPPHRPTPEVRPAGARMPAWEELALLQLLSRHQVYPLETLLDGVLAWRADGARDPLAAFLSRRAALPPELARKAVQMAGERVVQLRNRIARAQLAGLGRDPDALAAPPPGRQLPAFLREEGALTPDEAQEVDRRVNRTLQSAAERAVQAACAALSLEPSPLQALEARLEAAAFEPLLRAVLARLINQL